MNGESGREWYSFARYEQVDGIAFSAEKQEESEHRIMSTQRNNVEVTFDNHWCGGVARSRAP